MKKIEDPEAIAKHRSKKNTKRWCRGKTGVLHVKEVCTETRSNVAKFYTLRCKSCKKQFAWYHVAAWWPNYERKYPRPEWLVEWEKAKKGRDDGKI